MIPLCLRRPLQLCLAAFFVGAGATAWAQGGIEHAIPSPYEPNTRSNDAGDRYDESTYRYEDDYYERDNYAYVPGEAYDRPRYADEWQAEWTDEWYEEGSYEYNAYSGEVYDYDPKFQSDFSYDIDGQAQYGAEGYNEGMGYTGYGEVSDLYEQNLDVYPRTDVDADYYTDDWYDAAGVYNDWY